MNRRDRRKRSEVEEAVEDQRHPEDSTPGQKPAHSQDSETLRVARSGFAGNPTQLPHSEKLSDVFGDRNTERIRAFTGEKATEAAEALGADAYSLDGKAAFRGAPTVETAAHETAHVLQQLPPDGSPAEHSGLASADQLEAEAEGVAESAAGSSPVAKHIPGRARANLLQLSPNTREIDFEEAEQVTGDRYDLGSAGKDPYDLMQDYVERVTVFLVNMANNEFGAINQFLTHMTFASSTEAQPDVLGALFRNVGEELFEAGVSNLPGASLIPGSQILGAMKAINAEIERATKARHSFEVESFMTSFREEVLTGSQAALSELQITGRSSLEEDYEERSGEWNRETGMVVGDRARLLLDIEQRGQAMLESAPEPILYEQALITNWVTEAAPGDQVIELQYDSEKHDDGSYTYELEHAKVMTASNAGDAADMLNRVMSARGLKPYELDIPVRVQLNTEGMTPGGRAYFTFWIHSRDDYTTSHFWDPAWEAWNSMPWSAIDEVEALTG